MILSRKGISITLTIALAALCAIGTSAQGVKRVVLVKIDGLPSYYVDRFVSQRDPKTGLSVLPWIEEAFYKNGTRVPNFYTRGMSLSGPSWGQIDTGQHLQIKGNVEYDRYTLHAYDYLNFFPYYLKYGLSNRKADMPAVEVLDQLQIPLLIDAFSYRKRYTSQQLYQRGNNWEVIGSGLVNLYPGDPGDFIDEWTLGLDYRKITINQVERDILGKLEKNPEIDYFDYYDVSFDHISHHNNDTQSRLSALRDLDKLIGRMWVAIRESSRADETALVLISDHGFNSDSRVYSQGFNLVKLLTSPAGGGHHVVTKRRLMLDYSIKGIYPFVPLIKTDSKNSTYLQGQSSNYPTALLDFDGNERSSIHLRNSDLNVLHIMLMQLQRKDLSPEIRSATSAAFFDVIDRHRIEWRRTLGEMHEELDALQRWIGPEEKIVNAHPKKYSDEAKRDGLDKADRRRAALLDIAIEAAADYRAYAATLTMLSSLSRENFDPRHMKIEDVIAPNAMGDPNSIYQLQNYVAGPSSWGFALNSEKDLDMDRSFARVNYLELLSSQRVRNSVQKHISNQPIDFVALRIPAESLKNSLPSGTKMTDDPIWLYGGKDKQALILSQTDADGIRSYKYIPAARLTQDSNGKVTFEIKPAGDGFPLKYFEDNDFDVADRTAWFTKFHTESAWLTATHRTKYSNALIGLNEQLDRHPVYDENTDDLSNDDLLIRRFRQRQRQLTEADLLILADDHWNFDVRGFNPGGNHGSFFRVSTNSTLMIAGGRSTGIPRGMAVAAPYDSMSFVPTLLRLMGKIDKNNEPSLELKNAGFRKFPGDVIKEITEQGGQTARH
ncbi:MAG: alkaline phosphatase family protein [Pyrinomonadaceae bacterium]